MFDSSSSITRRLGAVAACMLTAAIAAPSASAQETSSATAEVTAGSLAFVGPPTNVDFGAFALTGANGALTGGQTFKVSDATGSSVGWRIIAGGTRLDNGGGEQLPATAVTIPALPSAACDASSSCTVPNNGAWTPFTLPVQPASAIMFRANAGSGMGIQDITPTWNLAVPANAAVGTYGATWTFTLASGPS